MHILKYSQKDSILVYEVYSSYLIYSQFIEMYQYHGNGD